VERHGHIVRVVGPHLAADGFHDGALLVIEPRSTPRIGELVLATLQDGRAVIRRWEKSAVDNALVPIRGREAADRSDVIPARRARILGIVKAQVVRYEE
jgi:SOS-response transcriptional repressor LexA